LLNTIVVEQKFISAQVVGFI